MDLYHLKHNFDYMYDSVYIIFACVNVWMTPCNYSLELPPWGDWLPILTWSPSFN